MNVMCEGSGLIWVYTMPVVADSEVGMMNQ